MAEFCLECWNKINYTNDPPGKYHLSGVRDYCEECGQRKHVIISVKRRYVLPENCKELIENLHHLKKPPVE